MEFLLSAEEREFAARLRDFFTCEIPQDIRDRVGRGEQPGKDDVVATQRILHDHALAVPHWPVEWGGRDWTPLQHHIWAVELALAQVPPPIVFNTAMVGPVIYTFGSRALRDRFLPGTASGDIWWSQGFSEPEAGSDLASLRTMAERDGDEYVVNGQKTWTTHGQHGDWIFCLVRTDASVPKQRGISFLLVDMRSPGVHVRPIQLIDGGHEVNEVFFDNVRVPADQLVGEENAGWSYAKFLLSNERTTNAGVPIVKDRIRRVKRLAGPLLDDPLFLARLTRLEVEAAALEMSVLRVLTDSTGRDGRPDPVSSVLKLRGTELQQQATELLVDVLGPESVPYREGFQVPDGFAAPRDGAVDAMPTYFNWRKASIYAGSNEIQRDIIAKTILGLRGAGS